MRRKLLVVMFVLTVLLTPIVLYPKKVLFFVFEQLHPLVFESALLTRPSDNWGMDLIPNLNNAPVVAADRPHDPRYIQASLRKNEVKRRRTFMVSTNEYAFRGPSIPLEKAPGELRVACVGDSITFGWGVDEALSYSGQLRTLLKGTHPDRKSSVINAGIPGFPPENIPGLIDHKLAPFKPDVIFILRNGNVMWTDPQTDYPRVVREFKRSADALGAKLIVALPPTSSFDVRPLNGIYAPLLEQFGKETGVPTFDFTPLFDIQGAHRGIKLEKRPTDHLLVRYTNGMREMLLKAPPDTERIHSSILKFIDASQDREALFIDEGHPDEEGNGIIARQILNILQAQAWLPAPP